MDLGTVTGDRINGLLDGKTGEWFLRFDTRKPALKKGLPLTLVLNRYVLLDILQKAVKPENIELGVRFDDGTTADGFDAIVAADGINSTVRKQIRGGTKPDGINSTVRKQIR